MAIHAQAPGPRRLPTKTAHPRQPLPPCTGQPETRVAKSGQIRHNGSSLSYGKSLSDHTMLRTPIASRTFMSQPDTQRIQPDHVIRQFARRNPLDEAQFLYGEIAQRMLQRLSYIRIQPHTILDAGCGNAHALEPLRSRYPDLDYIGLDACQPLLDTARQRYAARPGFWQRLRNRPTPPLAFVHADMAATDLTPESVDLVWSNMALHWHPEPSRVMAEWRRLLRPEGL